MAEKISISLDKLKCPFSEVTVIITFVNHTLLVHSLGTQPSLVSAALANSLQWNTLVPHKVHCIVHSVLFPPAMPVWSHYCNDNGYSITANVNY